MADGQVLIESKLDSSGVRKGVKEIKQDLTGIAKAADRAADDQTAAIKSAWNKTASESASGSRKVVDDLDDIGDKAESVGGKISSGIGGAFSKLAATAAVYLGAEEIFEAGLYAIETAADIRAENAQFTQTFKDLQSQATESLNVIAKETGITATRMRKAYTSVFAFSKSVGVDEAQALDIANRAMVVAADSAAYYDRSLEETTETLQSFLKGNYENDAALGFAATETTRNAKANELYAKSFDKLTEAQKVDVLLAMVEAANEASGALGQAALEADAWTNVTGELKEAWRQFVAVMGEPIMDYVTPILMDATTLLRDLPGLIEGFNLSEALGVDLEPIKTSLGDVVTAAGNLATTLSDSLKPVYDEVLVPLGKWTIEEGLPSSLGAIAAALEKNAAAVEWLAPLAPHVIDEYLKPLAEAASEVPVDNLNGIAEAFNSLKTALEELDIDAVDLFERFVTATQQIWGLDSPNLFADGIAETGEAADTASGQLDGIGTAAEEANTTGSTAMAALSGAIAGAFASAKDGAVSQLGEIQSGIDSLEGKDIAINIIPNFHGGFGGSFSAHGGIGGSFANQPAYTPSYAYEVPPQIPYLATGAVIPPNAPFMAVLGDQRSGTNLEAPEELIRKIVREETESTIETIVNINWGGSLAGLGRVLQPVISAETKRKGKSLSEEVAL